MFNFSSRTIDTLRRSSPCFSTPVLLRNGSWHKHCGELKDRDLELPLPRREPLPARGQDTVLPFGLARPCTTKRHTHLKSLLLLHHLLVGDKIPLARRGKASIGLFNTYSASEDSREVKQWTRAPAMTTAVETLTEQMSKKSQGFHVN